ncbi:MAG: alpha/beta fold hydrolase [Acidobacteriota bacterium]|jgi:homoserine O-acetyltransferase
MRPMAHLLTLCSSFMVIRAVFCSAEPQAADNRAPFESEWIVSDFRFHTGQILPDLRLHYITVGNPAGEPVLILHGTTGNGSQFLSDSFAGELFGQNQPLDTSKYFIILPDNIGHGKSSKPSDGMRANFPQYNYEDMVRAQYRLIKEHLGINHLRLIIGGSMGGMHAWMWGEMYPDFVDALMPLQCLPVEIAGKNRILRRIITDSIRNDPDWENGDYEKLPLQGLTIAGYARFALFTNSLEIYESYPTRDKADLAFEGMSSRINTTDANDLLYAFEASSDYNPEPGLEEIRARVFAMNTEDDSTNPPDLNILPRVIRRVKNGKYMLIPRSKDTAGHRSYLIGKLYTEQLREILK